MATAAVVGEDFSIGRVATRTFGTIGRNAATFFVLASLAAIPELLMQLMIGEQSRPDFANVGLSVAAIFGTAILSMAATAVLQAALVHGTLSDLNGRSASLADCLRTGVDTALPVIGISILQTIGMMLGFAALVVPGILLTLSWVVVVPVNVVEKLPVFECFQRSTALARGHRGAIFILMLLWVVVYIIPSVFIIPLSVGGTGTVSYAVLSTIVDIFVSTVVAAGVAAIYYELRSIKEGIGPEQLASVFD